MAHEFESGFFVREPAWHGLGTVVQNAPTSKEALQLAGLDWNVSQGEVVVNGIVIPGYKANIRDTDQSVLGIVSDKYKIVQNKEAFDFTDALLGEGITYETAGSLKNGKTTWILAKMDQVKVLGDKVDPYICFTNTHDGTGAVRVCLTPTRVVCQNTLNLALSKASRMWSTKHMGNIEAKKLEAAHTLGLANHYMTELAKEADRLATEKISRSEIDALLDELFGKVSETNSDCKNNNIKEAKETFYVCYLSPDLVNFVNTKYGVINAMADMVDHRSPNRQTKNYQENNFARVMSGHPLLDQTYSLLNI